MKQTILVAAVMLFPAVSAAEVGQSEADGLVVLRDCVKQFDNSPVNHRLMGVTEEALDECLLEAEDALEAELELVKSFQIVIPPIEGGPEGVGRMVAATSSVALEGMAVAGAVSAIESLRKWGPRWLEQDPIIGLRVAVWSLEMAREVFAAPM